MNKIILSIIFLFFLISCSGFNDVGKVLRGEKVNTTDEFLVKKRNPLVLPPNYEEIPKPKSVSIEEDNEDEKIKKILKGPKKEKIRKNKSSSIEDSILEKIR